VIALAVICTLATVAGFALAGSVRHLPGRRERLRGGCAAGDADRLGDPEATRKGRNAAGLVTVLGLAVAAALTGIG
jgi:hypothetical protein